MVILFIFLNTVFDFVNNCHINTALLPSMQKILASAEPAAQFLQSAWWKLQHIAEAAFSQNQCVQAVAADTGSDTEHVTPFLLFYAEVMSVRWIQLGALCRRHALCQE